MRHFREGLWVIEGVNDYGKGQVFTIVLTIELKDGKMWRDTLYYAEPFEAPECATNPKRPTLADAALMYRTERFCDSVYITQLVRRV